MENWKKQKNRIKRKIEQMEKCPCCAHPNTSPEDKKADRYVNAAQCAGAKEVNVYMRNGKEVFSATKCPHKKSKNWKIAAKEAKGEKKRKAEQSQGRGGYRGQSRSNSGGWGNRGSNSNRGGWNNNRGGNSYRGNQGAGGGWGNQGARSLGGPNDREQGKCDFCGKADHRQWECLQWKEAREAARGKTSYTKEELDAKVAAMVSDEKFQKGKRKQHLGRLKNQRECDRYRKVHGRRGQEMLQG